MNILFIIPNYPDRVKSYIILPSLELAIISEVLRKKEHICELLDMKINDYSISDLDNLLPKYKFDLILIESIIQDHCMAIQVIDKCKKINPDIPVALRGEISSFLPKECLERYKGLDYVLRFENELMIIDFVEALEGKKSLTTVYNLGFRDKKSGDIIINSTSIPIQNLDLLPMPNRKLYEIKKYYNRSMETIVRSSRGCPGKCLFCNKTKLAPFRIFSISRFCDEIEELINLGFSQFFFSDDTFAYSDARLNQFYEEIKRRDLKIRFTSNMRIIDITEEKIVKMKEIGAYRIFVGIETTSAKTSKFNNKNISKNLIEEKLNILRKHNVEVHTSFIVGNPGDTEEDLIDTCKFVQQIRPTLISFNQLKPMPGTDLYNNPEKYGIRMTNKYWFESDEWTRHSICSTSTLSSEEIDLWKLKLMKSFMES